MTVAIMQPYLFPYLGYFQLIYAADKFLLLDDVAYINKGWINRNRILVQGQPQYLSFPLVGASQNKLIYQLDLLADTGWKQKMEKTVWMAYKKAAHFEAFFPVFQKILMAGMVSLSDYIFHSLRLLCQYMELPANLLASTRLYSNQQLKGQERILALCQAEQADQYVNPPGGRNLYDPAVFAEKQIRLRFLQPQLPAYRQVSCPAFVPGLSIIDILMNCTAPEALAQVKQFQLD